MKSHSTCLFNRLVTIAVTLPVVLIGSADGTPHVGTPPVVPEMIDISATQRRTIGTDMLPASRISMATKMSPAPAVRYQGRGTLGFEKTDSGPHAANMG